MHERADRLTTGFVTVDQALEREFEALLVDSSTLVFRVAYSVLRHREDAEEVAQEAYANAYRKFRQLRDRGQFRPWIVRMTWRMALDRQRANRRRAAGERALEAPASSSPWPAIASRHRAEGLWEAIDTLSPKLRIVVVLASIEGHDIREVSALLNVPEGTVKSRLFLARQRLKERLSWMTSSNDIR